MGEEVDFDQIDLIHAVTKVLCPKFILMLVYLHIED